MRRGVTGVRDYQVAIRTPNLTRACEIGIATEDRTAQDTYVVFSVGFQLQASGCGRKHHLEIPRVDDEPLLAARVEHRFSCLFWFRISPDGVMGKQAQQRQWAAADG